MNNDILFFADLHLHERKEFNRSEGELGTRLQEGISILHQIANIVKTNQINNVVCLGDIFELKDRVPNHIQSAFGEALYAIDAHVYVLLGNHDFKIKKYPNIKVHHLGDLITLVERPRCLVINGLKIGFIPYYRDYEDFKKAWTRLHNSNPEMDIVCFHQTLPGITFNTGKRVPGTFNLELREGTKYISGHIHQTHEVFNKILYLGSPYQVTFGEAGEDKFIWLYQPDIGKFKPLKLEYPEFRIVNISHTLTQKQIQGNYIKLTGNLTPDQRGMVLEAKDHLRKWGAAGITSDIRYMREIKKRMVTSSNTPQEVIPTFVGYMSKALIQHLDTKQLIRVGEALLQEARQL